ncbi:putative iron-regulated membrane protein [Tenacibaculum adriaticum]|uniref:Putative iron-regulated membrane protein n=1 Tax=Tenacibaculum adriaticum TaxID=413713 RepID=A0A5S5DVU7_9FLAO|nr:PepSY domain-containing protein [Tenacibaculum adriaticum]TYP99981.1 putative iron-regulated membrane protein [Tenacibaculum adriaticum]
MKNRKLNQWLWKWHFIAGIISLPFVLLLSITGAIYLFKPDVEKEAIGKIQNIEEAQKQSISYQKQWKIAQKEMKKKPNVMILQNSSTKGTEFISGKFGNKRSLFVNQYTGEVSGKFSPKDTWMYKVRKLHGELLGGKVGTKIVELIASWMVVLILTGLYIWFPFKKGEKKGVFTIRFKEGKRTLFRDLHAVGGFWLSILLLMVLAGGFPWTDVFGSNFKTLQKITNTGYPTTWNGRGLTSSIAEKTLSLDDMVIIAKAQNLEGEISIGLPKNEKSTFSVSNKTVNLEAQKMLHFDQYSGKLIKKHNWSDVGFLMRGRMWLMAFHQGEFGGWNWWLMFFIAIGLTLMSVSALVSYLYRKSKGTWGIPKVPASFKVGNAIVVMLILLGLIFPLFGISLVSIYVYDFIVRIKSKKIAL